MVSKVFKGEERSMIERIIKRDGREVPFEIDKISTAIYKAAEAIGGHNRGVAEELAKQVEDYIEKEEKKIGRASCRERV